MRNLYKRIVKLEEKQKALELREEPTKMAKIFWRDKWGVPSKKEKEFFKKNPNYHGRVLTMCWVDPNAPEHCRGQYHKRRKRNWD